MSTFDNILSKAKNLGKKGSAKAKELAHKGIEKGKEGYGKAKEHVNKKIHDQKQEIAVDVIDETRNKVDSKNESKILNQASQIVEKKYEGGGMIESGNGILKTIFGC